MITNEWDKIMHPEVLAEIKETVSVAHVPIQELNYEYAMGLATYGYPVSGDVLAHFTFGERVA